MLGRSFKPTNREHTDFLTGLARVFSRIGSRTAKFDCYVLPPLRPECILTRGEVAVFRP